MPQRAVHLPKTGTAKDQLLAQMGAWREDDLRWRDGKVFSLVFFAGDEAAELLKEAYTMFFSENGLNPTAFPSLKRFETEVVSMSAHLLGSTGAVVGNMTSGGTESLLMAVVTAREWARKERPHIKQPEMVLPSTAHPAFEKAAHYFNVKPVHVPVAEDYRADVAAMEAAITPNTVLLVGSAPAYPHGVIDPISELGRVALSHGILLHVDACMGGYMLPFVRRLGHELPEFDFQVPGVTSISADLHKYGYAAKGASVILYKDAALRRHQLFAYVDWPGGIYASPTMGGTRPGGAIAAAWAIMNYLGEEGYLKIARRVMEAATAIRVGIGKIEGIHILGDPAMSLMAIGSHSLDVYELGDEMSARGWHMDRQHFPASLHLTINYAHVDGVDQFLADLDQAVEKVGRPTPRQLSSRMMLAAARFMVRLLPARWASRLTARASAMMGPKGSGMPKHSAPMYGMIGTLPNRDDLQEVVLDLVEGFTDPGPG